MRTRRNTSALNINQGGGLEGTNQLNLANLGVALGPSQTCHFFLHRHLTEVCAHSGRKKSLENVRAEQTLMVSTHQTESVLGRPSVCQQLGPRAHL